MLHSITHRLSGMALLVAILFAGCSGKTPAQNKAMNSIMIIAPYKYKGTWVFDDPATGLVREPFVAGIDTMIDKLVTGVPDADKGFRALFSATAFPGHTTKLEWRRAEPGGGNWYYSEQFKMEGWLCPALFKYFPEAPKEIYVQAEPLKP